MKTQSWAYSVCDGDMTNGWNNTPISIWAGGILSLFPGMTQRFTRIMNVKVAIESLLVASSWRALSVL
jgi:hypothetical protein